MTCRKIEVNKKEFAIGDLNRLSFPVYYTLTIKPNVKNNLFSLSKRYFKCQWTMVWKDKEHNTRLQSKLCVVMTFITCYVSGILSIVG